METNEQIISKITNIKVAGIASMSYWSIFKTSVGVYFVQSGSDMFLGLAGPIAGAMSDVVAMVENKVGSYNLSDALSSSVQNYKFNNDQFAQIKIKGRLFGGAVLEFSNGKEKSWKEAGFIRLKLSRGEYKIFSEMLK